MKTDYQTLVVGGGLAGFSAAIALKMAGDNVAIVSKNTSSADKRTTALFMPSIDFLTELGVWEQVKQSSAELKTMRILDGSSRLIRSRPAIFNSSEIDLDTFGYNIPNHTLLNALAARAKELKLPVIEGLATGYEDTDGMAMVTIEDGDNDSQVSAETVIAADGRSSKIRELAGIKHKSWNYPQKAIVLTFSHKFSHQNISTEFHTETGPFTQVPLPGNNSSLVWAIDPKGEESIFALEKDALNRMIEDKMQSILGAVDITSDLKAYPLSSLLAESFATGRVLLVGEAAHAFPPIGAQGLNLGLRDVMEAVNLLTGDADLSNLAETYHRNRRADIMIRTFSIDAFNRTLLTSFLPVQMVRSGALAAANALPPLKNLLMKQGALARFSA